MEKKEYLRKHYKMQHGCFFSTFYVENYQEDRVMYSYSDIIPCFIWNHAHVECMNLKKFKGVCEDVINFYKSRNRKSCIYVDESASVAMLKHLLASGFERVDNEAWMLFEKNLGFLDETDLNMIKVETDSHLRSFMQVCSECFEPEYSQAISHEHKMQYVSKSKIHFLFFVDDSLVGIGSVYYDNDIAIIHNIGVPKSYRRRGYGKALVKKMVAYIQNELHINPILLQCDGGGFVEEMYNKIGFTNVYRRFGYVR